MRGLKTSSIVSHLAEAIKHGLPVNIERLGVTSKIKEEIVSAIRAPPINSGTIYWLEFFVVVQHYSSVYKIASEK